MNHSNISCDEYINALKDFVNKSDIICDGWKLFEDKDVHKSYAKKQQFVNITLNKNSELIKAEFVIFYNLSYGAPSFSFNYWNSSGVLLSLDDIRQLSSITISKADFYSVITQQEHPLFLKPYFIMHPCHTESLLYMFKDKSKNIIVTFLSLITQLLNIDLPLEYGS